MAYDTLGTFDKMHSLGEELRTLRVTRGLSLGTAAALADLSKSALMGWESGRSRPRGAGLARLLDSLGASDRQKARLLHAADPAHARVLLADTPLGVRVDVGLVIRAMRLRRGRTQADLAGAIGTTQATVARWESGDAAPDGETVHAVGFALGASPEETIALACAQGGSADRLPEVPDPDPVEMSRLLWRLYWRDAPKPLHEVMLLGLEAELWPRAAEDPRWDAPLIDASGQRAVRLFLNGRLAEAEERGRQVLRLGTPSPETRLAQTHAFSALLEVATIRKANPAGLAAKIDRWIAPLPDGGVKGWMLWERGLRLAEVGRPDEAVDLTDRMAEQSALSWSGDDGHIEGLRQGGLLELELRAGRLERAEAAYERLLPHRDPPVLARHRVRLAHLRGEAAVGEDAAALAADPGDGSWYDGQKLAMVRREQARLERI